jgi:hypothetical protein
MNRYVLAVLCVLLPMGLAHAQMPPTPTNLVAENVHGTFSEVSLTWQVPQGQWYFKIYRSEGDSSNFETIGWAFRPEFDDHEVLLGRTYYYYVTSVVVDDSVLIESGRSNIASTITSTNHPTGQITGIITSDASGDPIAGVRIRVFGLDRSPRWCAPTMTGQNGLYLVQLDTGSYFIQADPPDDSPYQSEWFDNAPLPELATAVHVTDNGSATANFSLASRPPLTMIHVHGIVRTSEGNPISGAAVVYMRSIQEMNYLASTTGHTPGTGPEECVIPGLGIVRGKIWQGQTNSFGEYYALIPAGASVIAVAAKNGFMPKYFQNADDPTQAYIISAGRDTSGIDFQLPHLSSSPNSVRGTVRDSTGQPVPSRVILFPKPPGTQPPATTRVVHTDTIGNFEFPQAASGTYNVLAVPFSNYSAGFYKAGAYGIIHWQQADSIVVAGTLTNVNVGLVPVTSPGLTRISGRISNASGTPITGARLVMHDATGATVGFGVSNGIGDYEIDAAPTGTLAVHGDLVGLAGVQGSLVIPPNTYSISSNIVLGASGTSGVSADETTPTSFALDQSYPNPFNPITTIRYRIPEKLHVVLKVYNVLGKEVMTLVDEVQSGGVKSVAFDASGLSSGLYFYRIQAGAFTDVKRAMLLK